MFYLGSKKTLFKHILPHLLKVIPNSNKRYYEPFVGGFNSISQFPKNYYREGWDVNPYIIALGEALQKGWEPPLDISYELWLNIRENKGKFPLELVGYAGTNLTERGMWFQYYNKIKPNKRGENRSRIIRERDSLKGIKLYCRDFFKEYMRIPFNSIIYCDPPYKVYAHRCFYGEVVKFDTQRFWEIVTKLSKFNFVFISEYEAPSNFVAIDTFYKSPSSTGMYNSNSDAFQKRNSFTEKLFVAKDSLAYANRGLIINILGEMANYDRF